MYVNLKIQLWKAGLRQNQLAQMLNIDDTLLSKIVNGFRKPSAELRTSIAGLLECDEAWLFEETQEARPSNGKAANWTGNSPGASGPPRMPPPAMERRRRSTQGQDVRGGARRG